MTDTLDPRAALARLLARELLSEDALSAITGIDRETLRAHLAAGGTGMIGATSPSLLTPEQTTRLSLLAAQLTVGMEVGDDERLQAMLESLTIECRLTLPQLARLTGLTADDLNAALEHPATLPAETKYRLAVRVGYLVNATSGARGD